MSVESPLFGPRQAHGKLSSWGLVAQSTVANFMVKRADHLARVARLSAEPRPDLAAMGLFVVQTISFSFLYALVVGPERAGLDQCDTKSDCAIDCSPTRGGIPLR